MAGKEFAPVTPGEMLKDEFLIEYGLSQSRLAKAIGISPNRIAEIVNNRRRITADTALRLSLYFGNSPEFWMNLQRFIFAAIFRQTGSVTGALAKSASASETPWATARSSHIRPSTVLSSPPSPLRR